MEWSCVFYVIESVHILPINVDSGGFNQSDQITIAKGKERLHREKGFYLQCALNFQENKRE